MTEQRPVLCAGAWLMLVGLLTGLWAAAALTGTVAVAIPRLALAAHINALLGGLWCIAVATTLPHVAYGERRRRQLCALTVGAAWANWLITLVASILGVRGLTYGESLANNIVAAMLQMFVVIPSVIAAAMWAIGLARRQ